MVRNHEAEGSSPSTSTTTPLGTTRMTVMYIWMRATPEGPCDAKRVEELPGGGSREEQETPEKLAVAQWLANVYGWTLTLETLRYSDDGEDEFIGAVRTVTPVN